MTRLKKWIDSLAPEWKKGGYITLVAVLTGFILDGYNVFNKEARDSRSFDQEITQSSCQWIVEILRNEIVELKNDLRTTKNDLRTTKTALENLTKAHNSLRASNYSIPVPHWTKDRQGKYLDFNYAFERQLLLKAGVNPDSVIGRTDFEIFGKNVITEKWHENDEIVVQERRQVVADEKFQRAGGTIEMWRVYKDPFQVGRSVAGTTGIAFRLEFGNIRIGN